jgi:hypothetical protein
VSARPACQRREIAAIFCFTAAGDFVNITRHSEKMNRSRDAREAGAACGERAGVRTVDDFSAFGAPNDSLVFFIDQHFATFFPGDNLI